MRSFFQAFGVLLGCAALPLPANAQETRSPGLRLSVHAQSTRSVAKNEHVAWIGLTLPLGATAAAAAPMEPAAPPAPPAASEEHALSLPRLQALAEFARRAALVAVASSGTVEETRRLQALASRARWSALLPELELRAQRSSDQALRWAPTTDDPYRVTQADQAGTTLEARATFNLDRLVFAREELSVEGVRERASSEKLKLQGRVLAAVLGLFRARELSCSAADPEARLEQLLRTAEHFTELDVLTAGWFSAQAMSFSRAVWGFAEAVFGRCGPPPAPGAGASTKAVATHSASG